MSLAADWTTDQLISSIRRRANIPSSTEGWSNTDILALATDEMRESIVPMLRRLSEEYLVNTYDINVVSGTAEYRLPHWALGEALRDVQLLDGSDYGSMRRIEPHEAANIPSGNVAAYFLRDDRVTLVPTPSASTTSGLRLKCLRRPSKLVATSRGIATTTITTTVSVTVGTYALDGETAADTLMALLDSNSDGVDVVQALPGFRLLQSEQAGSYDSGTNVFTWGTALSSAPTVGDYLCYAGESVVPQIPAELHPLLAQSVACAYLRASGGPGLDTAEAKRAMMETEAINLFTPRTENQPRYVANKHGAGWGSRRFWGR